MTKQYFSMKIFNANFDNLTFCLDSQLINQVKIFIPKLVIWSWHLILKQGNLYTSNLEPAECI